MIFFYLQAFIYNQNITSIFTEYTISIKILSFDFPSLCLVDNLD